MRKLLLILILAAVGWYGYPYLKEHESDLRARASSLSSQVRLPSFGTEQSAATSDVMEKCITRDGQVIYGTVPDDVVCEKREAVGGSLTVVPSAAMRDGSGLPLQAVIDSEKQKTAGTQAAGAIGFRCDGRSECSQMTSCDEARYFLENCPVTEMDSDNNDIPCEQHWCY